jgi:hypothetical protein
LDDRFTKGIAISAVPSKETPAIVRAVWSLVVVEELPLSVPINESAFIFRVVMP